MDKSTNQQSLVVHTAPTQSVSTTYRHLGRSLSFVYGVACVKVGIDVSSLVEESLCARVGFDLIVCFSFDYCALNEDQSN
ncbi:hypothetical protein T07_14612 [Trichinella nelsoni]|uniref:Uncharacterized protein n=1 Tax=Trichinella nelsoni TaxID=6336 RepID=A0A0V0RN20_9BILA|nr:hypothetical protein T07_14612 [Trichinella nelsoni]